MKCPDCKTWHRVKDDCYRPEEELAEIREEYYVLRGLCHELVNAEHVPGVMAATTQIRDFLEKIPG